MSILGNLVERAFRREADRALPVIWQLFERNTSTVLVSIVNVTASAAHNRLPWHIATIPIGCQILLCCDLDGTAKHVDDEVVCDALWVHPKRLEHVCCIPLLHDWMRCKEKLSCFIYLTVRDLCQLTCDCNSAPM